MPITLIYGDNTYKIKKRVKEIIENNLSYDWRDFNYIKMDEGALQECAYCAFNEAMTSPFGDNKKIVHVESDIFFASISNLSSKEVDSLVSKIPQTSQLIITGEKKPDARKSTVKSIIKYSQQEEYNLIPPWDKQRIAKHLKLCANSYKLNLSEEIINYLVEAIGNDEVRTETEFAKLSLLGHKTVLQIQDVKNAVKNINSDYSKLSLAIASGDCKEASTQIYRLLKINEHPIKIIATLELIFRNWLIIKSGVEDNCPESKILDILELKNPKRLYYLKQEVQSFTLSKLKICLLKFIEIETELKEGKDNLQSKIIEVSSI